MVCHHPNKFGDHRHSDSRDIMFLICHITSHGQTFKRLCCFMGQSSSVVSHHSTSLVTIGIVIVEI